MPLHAVELSHVQHFHTVLTRWHERFQEAVGRLRCTVW